MHKVLHLGLSYNCNMKCSHCFVKRKRDALSFDDVKNLLDWLIETNLLVVHYTYGEPLLSKLFPEVSQYLAQKNIVQILMTNGSLIDESQILQFKKNQINTVYISIDHIDPKKHNTNRNYNKAFEKALLAIRLCKQFEINVGISTTVTNNNVDCLTEIYDMAIKENVKVISFLRERNSNKIGFLSEDAKKTYIEFFKTCINSNEINVKFHDPSLLCILEELYHESIISKDIYEKYYCMNSCHALNTISVSPDGNISHCNLIDNPFGNICNLSKNELHKSYDKELNNENIIHCSAISK